jgi:hypothetical protein
MKHRIFTNWRTSMLGIFLLIICIILLFLKTITLSEFIAFFPTILGLLYVRDTVFKITPRR